MMNNNDNIDNNNQLFLFKMPVAEANSSPLGKDWRRSAYWSGSFAGLCLEGLIETDVRFIFVLNQKGDDVMVEVRTASPYLKKWQGHTKPIDPKLMAVAVKGTDWEKDFVPSEDGGRTFFRGMWKGCPSARPSLETCENSNAGQFILKHGDALATLLHFSKKGRSRNVNVKTLDDAALVNKCFLDIKKFVAVAGGHHELTTSRNETQARISRLNESIKDLTATNSGVHESFDASREFLTERGIMQAT